jgi:hypothetical protein
VTRRTFISQPELSEEDRALREALAARTNLPPESTGEAEPEPEPAPKPSGPPMGARDEESEGTGPEAWLRGHVEAAQGQGGWLRAFTD